MVRDFWLDFNRTNFIKWDHVSVVYSIAFEQIYFLVTMSSGFGIFFLLFGFSVLGGFYGVVVGFGGGCWGFLSVFLFLFWKQNKTKHLTDVCTLVSVRGWLISTEWEDNQGCLKKKIISNFSGILTFLMVILFLSYVHFWLLMKT